MVIRYANKMPIDTLPCTAPTESGTPIPGSSSGRAEYVRHLMEAAGVGGVGSRDARSEETGGTGGSAAEPEWERLACTRGVIHEWFADWEAAPDGPGRDQILRRPREAKGEWYPPLGLLVHVATRTLRSLKADFGAQVVIWIGRRCWPHAWAMPPLVRRQSIYVEAESRDERVWAIDSSLRCAGVACVVADGHGLSMAATRRFQLAAGAGRGGGALGAIARPPWERKDLSAAQTRWMVRALPTEAPPQFSSSLLGGRRPHESVDLKADHPRWTVELLRCKGMRPAEQGARAWTVQRHHETGHVSLVPAPADRSLPASAEARAS